MTTRLYSSARLTVKCSLIALLAWAPIALAGQDGTSDELARIYRDYRARRSDIASLIAFDERLRELFRIRNADYIEAKYQRPEYESLGIEPTLFEPDILIYTGKLLVDAHRLNPKSEYRRYTLYSTVFPDGNEHGNGVPSPRAAETYLREFPDGPFAAEVTRTLAFFYDDLYKVIRFELEGDRIGYKHACFERFLSNRPNEQVKIAQQAAISYYRKSITLLPDDKFLRDTLLQIEAGRNIGWHYCAD